MARKTHDILAEMDEVYIYYNTHTHTHTHTHEIPPDALLSNDALYLG